jgi:hypothetical protein
MPNAGPYSWDKTNASWTALSSERNEMASKVLLYEPKILEIDAGRMLLVQYLVRKNVIAGLFYRILQGRKVSIVWKYYGQLANPIISLHGSFRIADIDLKRRKGFTSKGLVIHVIFTNCVCLFGSPREKENCFLLS